MFLAEAIKILLIASGLLFVVFAYFCDLWTERDPRRPENILAGIAISSLYVFKIIFFSFLIIFVFSLFLDKIIY